MAFGQLQSKEDLALNMFDEFPQVIALMSVKTLHTFITF
jgi:hypothetical protein